MASKTKKEPSVPNVLAASSSSQQVAALDPSKSTKAKTSKQKSKTKTASETFSQPIRQPLSNPDFNPFAGLSTEDFEEKKKEKEKQGGVAKAKEKEKEEEIPIGTPTTEQKISAVFGLKQEELKSQILESFLKHSPEHKDSTASSIHLHYYSKESQNAWLVATDTRSKENPRFVPCIVLTKGAGWFFVYLKVDDKKRDIVLQLPKLVRSAYSLQSLNFPQSPIGSFPDFLDAAMKSIVFEDRNMSVPYFYPTHPPQKGNLGGEGGKGIMVEEDKKKEECDCEFQIPYEETWHAAILRLPRIFDLPLKWSLLVQYLNLCFHKVSICHLSPLTQTLEIKEVKYSFLIAPKQKVLMTEQEFQKMFSGIVTYPINSYNEDIKPYMFNQALTLYQFLFERLPHTMTVTEILIEAPRKTATVTTPSTSSLPPNPPRFSSTSGGEGELGGDEKKKIPQNAVSQDLFLQFLKKVKEELPLVITITSTQDKQDKRVGPDLERKEKGTQSTETKSNGVSVLPRPPVPLSVAHVPVQEASVDVFHSLFPTQNLKDPKEHDKDKAKEKEKGKENENEEKTKGKEKASKETATKESTESTTPSTLKPQPEEAETEEPDEEEYDEEEEEIELDTSAPPDGAREIHFSQPISGEDQEEEEEQEEEEQEQE